MSDHSETRKVLWLQRANELGRAQELDREIEGFMAHAKKAAAEASECRRRAREFKTAAEAIATLDNDTLA